MQQTPLLLKPTHCPAMRGRAKADRELEVVVQSGKEAADEPADWSEPAPPSVEPADVPAVSTE